MTCGVDVASNGTVRAVHGVPEIFVDPIRSQTFTRAA